MPERPSFLRVNGAAGTRADAAWPWRMGGGSHGDSGAAVPAAGAVNPLLIRFGAALGSGMSTSFVAGGGEGR